MATGQSTERRNAIRRFFSDRPSALLSLVILVCMSVILLYIHVHQWALIELLALDHADIESRLDAASRTIYRTEVETSVEAVTKQVQSDFRRTVVFVIGVSTVVFFILNQLLRQLKRRRNQAHVQAEHAQRMNHMLFDKIAEKESTEQELQESVIRNMAIMASSRDPLLIVDDYGLILSASDSTEAAFGWKPEELVGENIRVLVPEPHRTNHDGYMAAYRETGKTFILGVTREFNVVRKDGSDFPCELTVNKVEVPGHDAPIFMGIIRDITERVEAHAERDELELQLRQSQKLEAVGTLAGGIAHDFNNSLTAILGFAHLVRDEASDAGYIKENAGEIIKASERAAKLVSQILTFSRKADEKKERIDPQEVIEEAVRLLRSSLPMNIEITAEYPEHPLSVMADATQLHQIVVNLFTNAAGAITDSSGEIQLTLDEWEVDAAFAATRPPLQPGRHARIRVSDTGSGISEAIIHRIFEPFFTTKDVNKGTGMGLAVIHSIVTQHEGAIDVESVVGEGTTFTVLIPQCPMGRWNDGDAEDLQKNKAERAFT